MLYELLISIHNIDLLRVIFHPLPIIFIFSLIVYMLVVKNNLIQPSCSATKGQDTWVVVIPALAVA